MKDKPDEFKNLLEESVLADNQRLDLENKEIKGQLTTSERKRQASEKKARENSIEQDAQIQHLMLQTESNSSQLAAMSSQIDDMKANQVASAERERQLRKAKLRSDRLLKWVLTILLWVGVVALVYYAVNIVHWAWLLNHPNLPGMVICAMLMLLGSTWAIWDSKHRQGVMFGIVLAALLVVAQIAGSR